MQDCVRAEVKELFRRSICFTEGGICRGTDIGWFSNRTGTSVDDSARKSNNWLDQTGWNSKKSASSALSPRQTPFSSTRFRSTIFRLFCPVRSRVPGSPDVNRGAIRTSCAMSRSLAIGIHFLFNPVQVPLWLMLRLALSLIEVTEGIAFFLFVSLLEWCAFDNIQYMGSGRTERLLRSASNVSVAQHALPGCVERYAWRGRSRKPQTLAS